MVSYHYWGQSTNCAWIVCCFSQLLALIFDFPDFPINNILSSIKLSSVLISVSMLIVTERVYFKANSLHLHCLLLLSSSLSSFLVLFFSLPEKGLFSSVLRTLIYWLRSCMTSLSKQSLFLHVIKRVKLSRPCALSSTMYGGVEVKIKHGARDVLNSDKLLFQ